MKCNKCGKDNIEGSKFCKYCGAEMVEIKSQTHNIVMGQNGPQEVKLDAVTKGCKVWFWFVIIVNALSAVSGLALISAIPFVGLVTVISGIAIAAGSGMILFKHKKVGLYIIIGMAVVNCFINIVNNAGILTSIISAVLCPAISYYFVNKNSDIIK